MALKIKEDGEWKATGTGGGGEPTVIVDALDSTLTDAALSANQGRVLDESKADTVHTHKAEDIDRLEAVAINAMLSRKEMEYSFSPDDDADGKGHPGTYIAFDEELITPFDNEFLRTIQISVSKLPGPGAYVPTLEDLGGFATAIDRFQWTRLIALDLFSIAFDPIPGFRGLVTITIDPVETLDGYRYYFKGPWREKNPEDEESFAYYSSIILTVPAS